MTGRFVSGCAAGVMVMVMALTCPPARADNFLCPEELSTKQIAVDTPLGWKANSNIVAKMGLSGISLYDGPPDDGRDSLPPVKRIMKGQPYQTWAFAAARKAPVWMACEYHGTAVILMRAMPDTLHQCRTVETGAYDHPNVLDCE